ncbi:nuclear transport factor 2 family protein [soil metagenome]
MKTPEDLITTYFARAVDTDRESYFALFADDVVVEDEGRERHGIAAIREWRAEVPMVTYTPGEVAADGDAWRVVSTIHGDFPGSPVDLTFTFRFDEYERISELRIRS